MGIVKLLYLDFCNGQEESFRKIQSSISSLHRGTEYQSKMPNTELSEGFFISLLTCKVMSPLPKLRNKDMEMRIEREDRLQTGWPCTARKESALSPEYFQLPILRDDHSILVCSVLPDEERPGVTGKHKLLKSGMPQRNWVSERKPSDNPSTQ